MNTDKFKVPVSMLTPSVDPTQLGFEDTSELEPLTDIIGQERAVEALEFGLSMKSPGFNLYVSGPVGTGKATLVRQMVKRLAQAAPAPSDWCYVNNFQDPSRPASLSFAAGQGCAFKRDMAAFIDSLRRDIPAAFESKKYLDAKAKLHDETEAKKKLFFQELTQLSLTRGFGFDETPAGFGLVPLKDGHPMTSEALEAMTEQEQQDLNERRLALEGEIREFHVRLHTLDKEVEHQLRHLDRQVVTNVLEGRYETMRRTYQDLPSVCAYLERVQDNIVHHYKDFLPHEGPALPIPGLEFRRPDLTRYLVNLIVEHDPANGAPVIDESHPTYTNLIGKIERRAHMGVMYTDFTEIRAPFDCVVLVKNANVGDLITPFSNASGTSGAVVTVADMSTLEVEADVSESNVAQVKPDQPVEITLDAIPGVRFRGSVSRIVPTVDRAKATVMTKVRFEQLDPRILPEMSAKVSFLSQAVSAADQQPVLAVPPQAIATRDGHEVVFRIGADDKASAVTVAKGRTLGDVVELRQAGGLKAGDRLVLSPPEGLKDQARVKVAAAGAK